MRNLHKNPSTNPLAGQQGFTLLEVMIALVIFAVGVLGLAAMQIDFIQGNDTARELTEAANRASDKIEQLMSVGYTDSDLDVNANPHTEAGGGYNLSWTVQHPDQDGSGGVNDDEDTFKTIQITVTWNDGTARSFTMNTMRVEDP